MDAITSAISSLFSRSATGGGKRSDAIRAKLGDLRRNQAVVRETLTAAKAELAKAGAAAALKGERPRVDRTALLDSEAHFDELTLATQALEAALGEAEKEEKAADIARLKKQAADLVAPRQALQVAAWASIEAGLRLLRRTRSESINTGYLPTWLRTRIEGIAADPATPLSSIASALESLGAESRLPGCNQMDPDQVHLPDSAPAEIAKEAAKLEVRIAKSVGYDADAAQKAADMAAETARVRSEEAAKAKAEHRAKWVAAIQDWAAKAVKDGIADGDVDAYQAGLAAADDLQALKIRTTALAEALAKFTERARRDGVDYKEGFRNRATLARLIGLPVYQLSA